VPQPKTILGGVWKVKEVNDALSEDDNAGSETSQVWQSLAVTFQNDIALSVCEGGVLQKHHPVPD
jgi:hypothetical protein